MSAILNRIAALKEGRRSAYLWNTKIASAALGCGENKLGEWVYRTKRKIMDLYKAQPGETVCEFATWIAEAEAERKEEAEAI